MATVKQIGMAAGTFSIALGIGFVMQNGDALASRFGAEDAPEQPAPFTQEAADPSAQPTDAEAPVVLATLQGGVIGQQAPRVTAPDAETSVAVVIPEVSRLAPQPETPLQLATLEADTPLSPPEADADVTVEVDCTPVMDLNLAPAATVAVSISAPCHLETAFTMHHQGMMFTAMTDDEGQADFDVPALAEEAVLIAAFADGNGAVESIPVSDFANYERAVLQWQGETSVMLSAYEGGSAFGDTNHIHAGNPGNLERLTAEEGGFLIRLGKADAADPLIAEVYTFPSTPIDAAYDVTLVAEAEITEANCGQDLSAQSIQISPNAENAALDLSLTMPECDAIGDVLILQNMFRDLTLASR